MPQFKAQWPTIENCPFIISQWKLATCNSMHCFVRSKLWHPHFLFGQQGSVLNPRLLFPSGSKNIVGQDFKTLSEQEVKLRKKSTFIITQLCHISYMLDCGNLLHEHYIDTPRPNDLITIINKHIIVLKSTFFLFLFLSFSSLYHTLVLSLLCPYKEAEQLVEFGRKRRAVTAGNFNTLIQEDNADGEPVTHPFSIKD